MCLAVPGEILSVDGSDLHRMGRVSFAGVEKDVSLGTLPEAQVGDYVLVHVGIAIQVVDRDEARQTLEYLAQMGELAGQGPDSGAA